MVKMSSYIPPCEVNFVLDYGIIGSYDAPPLFLCGLQYFGSSEEIECQLSEFDIDGVLNQFRKPGSVGTMVKMTDTEVLFNNIDSGFLRWLCFVLFHIGSIL